jgi:hypothetical protein
LGDHGAFSVNILDQIQQLSIHPYSWIYPSHCIILLIVEISLPYKDKVLHWSEAKIMLHVLEIFRKTHYLRIGITRFQKVINRLGPRDSISENN